MSPLMGLYVVVGTILLLGVGALVRAKRNELTPAEPIPDEVMRQVARRAAVWALVLAGVLALMVIARRARM